MSESAYQALKRALENRGKETTITVDGYTTFLFLKRDGTQKVGMDYNTIIRNLMKKYNKWHKESLPNITPHSPSAYVPVSYTHLDVYKRQTSIFSLARSSFRRVRI